MHHHIDPRGLSSAFLMQKTPESSGAESGAGVVVSVMILEVDNTNRAIMTNAGVRVEVRISCPDNIETKPAISGTGEW